MARFHAEVGRLLDARQTGLSLVHIFRATEDAQGLTGAEFEIRFYSLFTLSQERITFPLVGWTVKASADQLIFVRRGVDGPSVIGFIKMPESAEIRFSATHR